MTALGIAVPAAGRSFDVVGIGQNAVDHLCVVSTFPTLDSKQTLAAYDCQPGGMVATALVALQRWGWRTAYVGTFGDDALGDLSRRSLVEEGVDVAGSVRRSGVANQMAVILVDEGGGERTILVHRSPALTLAPDELHRERVTAGRVLHLDGLDLDASLTAAAWARAAGIPIVVDVDTPTREIARLLALTDAVIVSRDFALAFTGAASADAALEHLAGSTGSPVVVVTLGAEGALARARAGSFRVAGHAVRCVDTTGAGDIFHAGFIHGMLRGWELEPTLAFANAAAALKCTRVGGRPGIPTPDEAERLAGR